MKQAQLFETYAKKQNLEYVGTWIYPQSGKRKADQVLKNGIFLTFNLFYVKLITL